MSSERVKAVDLVIMTIILTIALIADIRAFCAIAVFWGALFAIGFSGGRTRHLAVSRKRRK